MLQEVDPKQAQKIQKVLYFCMYIRKNIKTNQPEKVIFFIIENKAISIVTVYDNMISIGRWLKVLLIKKLKKHIYETIFEGKICKLKKEEQKHRNLIRKFHNPYIYGTGKDICCVSSHMEVTNN